MTGAKGAASSPKSPLVRAVLWMAGALTSFLVMAVAVRELTGAMSAFQMLFIRSGLGFAFLLVVLSATGWGQARTQRLTGHLFRNVAHFTGQVLWIVGIQLLPLATVFAIEFTTPIWGAILAVLFLGESMNRGRWIALTCGFIGILVILRPGLGLFDPDLLVMIACAFFFGLTTVITKWLTRTESALTILFYMTLMQMLFGLAISVFDWAPVALDHWPWLVLLAITGLSAHYCIVRALGCADATIVMPMDFLRLPLIAVLGFLVYAEPLDPVTLIGAVLIFAGNYYSIRRESRGS
ncbi:MAG: DMT family transporter [Pseudomonadota bacterium]